MTCESFGKRDALKKKWTTLEVGRSRKGYGVPKRNILVTKYSDDCIVFGPHHLTISSHPPKGESLLASSNLSRPSIIPPIA
jgi:hypothetical protein